ncbi:alternative oxidase 3, mitochondrial-like [Abrus precatorius]|uniref:Ubiquinol oxidase n=1 Tax=Abrus precatorius TaxID=3816 RepID=A0A8B8KZ42_ABRPR|nr:alternative oxidase 3, mitochondrial-like [Abrus precatorius]
MKPILVRSAARALLGGGRNYPRHFSTAAIWEPRHQHGGGAFGSFYLRRMSTLPEIKDQQSEEKKNEVNKKNDGVVSSYWGITRPKVHKEDGTDWPWNCFMPWDTYRADVSIDVTKHHLPKSIADKVAFRTVKFLRVLSDLYFKERYGCHAMMLETIAAVPGMVGGMLLHFKSLRKFQHSGGWIKALLEEAENERMHLMTMVELVKPKWHERLLVITAQGVFFNAFFVFYLLSPKAAHRFVGYLEEEAVISYTQHLDAIQSGKVENVAAPAIAIDYWRLPKDATLKDVITVIRADECHHRDVNHFASVSVNFVNMFTKHCLNCFISPYSERFVLLRAGYSPSRKGIKRGSSSSWLSLSRYFCFLTTKISSFCCLNTQPFICA